MFLFVDIIRVLETHLGSDIDFWKIWFQLIPDPQMKPKIKQLNSVGWPGPTRAQYIKIQ